MSKSKKVPTAAHPVQKGTPVPTVTNGWPESWLIAGLAALAFLIYANTLGHNYVLDDALALSLHEHVSKGFAGIGAIFTAPYRSGCFGGCLYRPLPLTTFAVEWAVAPNNPTISHFINVLWYTLTAPLLYITLRRLLPAWSAWLPFAAALLFVVHPVHTEVVANIKSRDEILCLFFTIAAIYFFARQLAEGGSRFLVFAGLAYLLGLLSKESAVTATPLFPLIAFFFFGQSAGEAVKKSLWLLVPLTIFFALRGAALSGLEAPAVSMMDNPIVAAHGWGERLGTGFMVLARYLGLLFFPLTLISDYSYNVLPVNDFGNMLAIIGLVLYGGLAGYGLWQLPKRNPLAFCALAYLSGIALYSQIPVMIGTLMGERLLYFPSLWACLAITIVLAKLLKTDLSGTDSGKISFRAGQTTFVAIIALITVLLAVKTISRNTDWKNNFALFEADVAKAPNSVRLNNGYAEELYKSTASPDLSETEKNKRLAACEQYSRQSLTISPSLSAYINLGNVRTRQKKYAEAVGFYEKSLEVVPDFGISKKNMADVLTAWAEQEGPANIEKARELLLKANKYNDKNAATWHLLGVSYGVQGNHPQAAAMFARAYELDPTNRNNAQDLINAYKASGELAKAAAIENKIGK